MNKPVILCVDDEPIILESLQSELEDELGKDYQIELSESGEDALELIEELKTENCVVALVIADYVMPGIKGDELLSRIHENDPQIVKIMLTGHSTVRGIGNAVNNAGLYRFIPKPWEQLDLILTVKEALISFQRQHEIEKTQAALRHSEAQFRSLSTSAPIGIGSINDRCQCLYVNKQWERISGFSEQENLGEGWFSMIHSDSRERLIKKWRTMIAEHQEISEEFQIESPCGEIHWGALRSSMMYEEPVVTREYVVTLQDVTELKKNQEVLEALVKERTQKLEHSNEELKATVKNLHQTQNQLVVQEKLASLGKMAAGISHEIKNPLNFINNFSMVSVDLLGELQEKWKSGEFPQRSDEIDHQFKMLQTSLESIYKNGNRVNNIIETMLLHASGDRSPRRIMNLHNLLEQYLEIACLTVRNKDATFKVENELDFDPEMPEIEVFPKDIGRVFLNIFSNSFYSLQEKIQKERKTFTPKTKIRTRILDGHAEICVWDNGTGTPPDNLNQLFEPFFTTKPPGIGTGLGLSLSYEIVTKGHQGQMVARSREGEFMEIVITLPLQN